MKILLSFDTIFKVADPNGSHLLAMEWLTLYSILPMENHRKDAYTEDQAKRVSVVGWVKNTPYGTVTGQVQGSKEKVDIMKNWLSNVGSPMSRIDKTVFANETQIQDLGYSNFQTKY
ncbi:unnamed protein product [Ranitomeya imitator]|uniref:Acylphosphatase-like domain-containing protein n=1 Tax=Ranitomeya imitator TaxID=111125 RepID=A0ABN9L8C1_9NEOB|nr:unnamed protein product [Ranitomeya imitator]